MKRWLQKMINGPVWRRAVVWAGTIAGGVLLGRVDLLGGIMPFGGAWVMAAGMAGLPVTGAILGVLVGTLTLGVSLTHLTVLLPAALVFFAMLVARRTQWQPGVGMGILLLTAARLSLLPFSAFLIYDLVRFAIESLLAAGSCYVLCHAAQAAQQRFHMKEGRQRLCVTVAAAMLLCGLTDAEVFGFFPQYFLAAGLTLWAAWVGGGALGAACGLGVGMVLSLGGVDVSVAAALGAGGLLCGVFRPAGRVFCALGLLLGDVVMTAWTTLFAVPALPLLETAAAALTLVVVPTRPAKQFAQSILPSQQERERQRELKLDKLRSETVERIDCFAQCLEELSGVFSEAVVSEAGTMEDVAPLLEAVADEACGDCPLFERCWEKEFYVTYQCFVRTLTAPGKRRIILEEDFPPEFRRKCRRFEAVMRSLRTVYSLFRIKTGYRKRIEESRFLVGRQLSGVSRVMEELAGQVDLQIRFDDDAAALVRQALENAGVSVRSAVAHQTAGGLVVNAAVKGCGGKRKCRNLESIISRALGYPMRKAPNVCKGTGTCSLCFRQAAMMHVACTMRQMARETGMCGDSCVHMAVEDGYFMAVSDGMGTGARAAMESKATISLLKKFYAAGFPEDIIFDAINQVMLLRSASEMYSTVDFCKLDLVAGEARFIKIGAPPSFILRGSRVLSVLSPSLPLGIMENVTPGAVRRVLEDGDLVVMLSDGICAETEME
ncbi:MAG: SpoIIE family protein phosphatase [Eubacteriales bacterium]|nr:SpoIIE family protein phosphatase [Eubacteriales bacterium]